MAIDEERQPLSCVEALKRLFLIPAATTETDWRVKELSVFCNSGIPPDQVLSKIIKILLLWNCRKNKDDRVCKWMLELVNKAEFEKMIRQHVNSEDPVKLIRDEITNKYSKNPSNQEGCSDGGLVAEPKKSSNKRWPSGKS